MRTTYLTGLSGIIVMTLVAIAPQFASAATIRVTIVDDQFIAKTIDIAPGDTVVWVNTGSMNHTVTADNGSFDSGTLAPQAQYSQLFTQPGSYPYYCKFHGGVGGSGMSGLIRVNGVALQPTPQTITPVISTPVVTTTSSQTAALLAQIAQLQQLIASIKSSGVSTPSSGVVSSAGGTLVPTGGSSNTSCPALSRALQYGMSGADVAALQQFLARDTSVYPEGQTSGYFGALTQAAVQRFQIKYNIVSSGSPETTGFGAVGPATRGAIAQQCASGSSSGSDATVGGLLQVTPNSGAAPLQVSATATVNLTNSCQAALYTIDWGDGSAQQPIQVSAGTCQAVQQAYTHTYNYGGSYAVTLSAGGNHQSAIVTVTGAANPGVISGGVVGNGSFLLTMPSGGQNYAYGQKVPIVWKSAVPNGSTIVFDLYTGGGQKVSANDVIAITQFATGSLDWTIPNGSQVCPAVYPGGLCGTLVPSGSYRIHATAYAASPAGNTYSTTLASADSGIFTIISSGTTGVNTNFTYSPLVVVPAASGNPLAATATFDLSSSCELYNISWGDGAVESNANSTNTACTTTPGTRSVTHTYTLAGSYTITLQRGASLSHVDSIGYTVSN